ncbi:transglutaminase [Roseivivax halodurans JCM 10272]|uniref:Transglutaminase n=1 Tax=Roseivivax halodurans JCM 10272 TaxID=1449350 RepID=X7EGA0_9RHOB|nr:transglutaminase [Roseivivax halodurans JCM 10272]
MLTRRTLMALGAASAASALLPHAARAAFTPRPDGWRRFELTTRIVLPETSEPAQVWVPVPSITEPGWMNSGSAQWKTSADTVETKTDPESGAEMVHATWEAGAGERVIEVTATARIEDRYIDLTTPQDVAPLSEADRARYTAATDLIPTDGIVQETAAQITDGASGDFDKARRIYDWVVENSARNPETRGCGLGDIASMLHMGDLTGKCADLNALFVGLARASGLPARDVYGIRVAPSEFGYKSLGAGSSNVTGAQHCRAEVFLSEFGWVPADPADVRKVMLEEPPKDLPLDHPKVEAARRTLFGAWEGNWVGYNFAHDVRLPGSANDPVPFLMYPQAEIAGDRRDPLDPESFAYTITAREIG